MSGFLKKFYKRKDPSLTMFYKKTGANIGNNCSFIGYNINFGSEPYLVTIGNNVRVSFNVTFITHDGGVHVLRNELPNLTIYGPITIGNNCFIGANVTILPNVTIGDNCIIGAGSIVTKNVKNNSVVAGVPAKYICSIEEYKNKNRDKFSYLLNKSYEERKRILLEGKK